MPKFADIIAAVRTELGTNVLKDVNRVKPIARRTKVPELNGDIDILLRPRGVSPITNVDGAGRTDMRMRRILEVIPRLRWAIDEMTEDKNFLLDVNGFLALEDKIIDRLELFQPTNKAGTAFLTYEPMRFIGTGDLDKDIKPDGKWGISTLLYEVCYVQDLDQTRQ